jgi:hypothetical protein
MDRIRPDVVIDDGANFSRLMVMERPSLAARLVGVAEETTSGVRAFAAMQQEGELPFPVVAVNDSRLKTGFDNRHGTGETCAATTMSLVGPSFFSAAGGARVTVVGFGPVGEGFARRVRALGARVTVAEADPVRALEASFAGFAVAPLDSALPATDMAVSATGVRHTLPADALRLLPDGATVAVIGGIANEVALDQVLSQGGTLRPGEKTGVSWLDVPQGPTLRLLASGDGVNYAAGPGNPIEIMDLSFAVQLAAVEHLLRHAGSLPARGAAAGSRGRPPHRIHRARDARHPHGERAVHPHLRAGLARHPLRRHRRHHPRPDRPEEARMSSNSVTLYEAPLVIPVTGPRHLRRRRRGARRPRPARGHARLGAAEASRRTWTTARRWSSVAGAASSRPAW